MRGDQLAGLRIASGGMHRALAPAEMWEMCPSEGNGLYQKARSVTATALEEARHLHEAEGWRRFLPLVHAGSSMADV